jgi:hypothetical protein
MLSKSFVTAGRASFIVANPSGESVTVKVSRARQKHDSNGTPMPVALWVSVRHNNNPWLWVGRLDAECGTIIERREIATLNGTLMNQHVMKIANWALDCIWKGLSVPTGYRLEHTGRCGRCGKMLRDADSIKSGFGPECIKYI